MDRLAYKVSMSIEACLLVILMSTFYLTSMIGVTEVPELCATLNMTTNLTVTSVVTDCDTTITTSTTTKVVFAIWVWAIYFTFPGTYSTQVLTNQNTALHVT